MEFNQKKPIQRKEFDGCEVKLRRDRMGQIVGIKTSGKCTKEQVEFMRESIRQKNPEFNSSDEEF